MFFYLNAMPNELEQLLQGKKTMMYKRWNRL